MLLDRALARAPLWRRDRLSRGGNGLQSRRGLASDGRIVPEAGSATGAQDDWLPAGRADELKAPPSTTGPADAAASTGVLYLGQVLGMRGHSLFTIERRSPLRSEGSRSHADENR